VVLPPEARPRGLREQRRHPPGPPRGRRARRSGRGHRRANHRPPRHPGAEARAGTPRRGPGGASARPSPRPAGTCSRPSRAATLRTRCSWRSRCRRRRQRSSTRSIRRSTHNHARPAARLQPLGHHVRGVLTTRGPAARLVLQRLLSGRRVACGPFRMPGRRGYHFSATGSYGGTPASAAGTTPPRLVTPILTILPRRAKRAHTRCGWGYGSHWCS